MQELNPNTTGFDLFISSVRLEFRLKGPTDLLKGQLESRSVQILLWVRTPRNPE